MSTTFPYVQHELANGLRLVVSPDRVAPVVAVNLWYDVGSRHERPGRTGFAHLFEHLMFEGSTNVGSGEHMRLVLESGGAVNGTTSTERTVYTETVSVEQLELILFLEADRMRGLLGAVSQEALDKQRDVVRNERRQRYDDQPYGTAYERLYALLYPEDHPYHHTPIGSMADLAAASLEDVHGFFRSHYAPDNAVLALVGDIDPDHALELVSKHLGDIPRRRDLPTDPEATLTSPLPAPARVSLQEAVPASALFLGYRLPVDDDPTLPALEVAMAVLASGRSSALHRKLVRAELAQQVNAGVDRRVVGASIGIVIAIGRQGVKAGDIEAVVVAEIERLATNGPDAVELARAKSMLERNWLDRLGSLEGRAEEFARSTTLYGEPGEINGRVDRLRAPSAEDVRAAVAQHVAGRPPAVVEYAAIGEGVAA
jgi:predicted Zn-dependent peptidase